MTNLQSTFKCRPRSPPFFFWELNWHVKNMDWKEWILPHHLLSVADKANTWCLKQEQYCTKRTHTWLNIHSHLPKYEPTRDWSSTQMEKEMQRQRYSQRKSLWLVPGGVVWGGLKNIFKTYVVFKSLLSWPSPPVCKVKFSERWCNFCWLAAYC